MFKKNKKNLVIVMALIAVMAIGGISAYFTSADDAKNVWTVGKVKIDLQEPNYDSEDPDEREDITPNKEFEKDPKVQNTGINDTYVFIKFSMPKANVIVADQNGQRQEAALQELFDYQINDGWTQVAADTSADDKNTYVYAYAKDNVCTPLAKDDTTPVLFKNATGTHIDNPGVIGIITFKNVIEGQGLEGITLEVPVEAYGIQTTDLGTDNVNSPAEVWSILSTQTNDTIVDDLTNYVDFK